MADDFEKEVEETKAKLGVESTDVEDETKGDEAPDTDQQEKETSEEDTQEEPTEEETDEQSDADGEEDSEEGESEESTFKKRFTQFKGDTPEEYIPHLEEAYWNSSAEAIRLAKENDALKKQLEAPTNEKTPVDNQEQAPVEPTDPALAYSRKELRRRMDEDYARFKEEYPIVDRDPEVVQRLDDTARKMADHHLEQTGEYMDLYDLLKMAAAYLNLEPDKSEKIASAAKEQAAMSKTSTGSKKTESKGNSGFTEKQIATAEKFGLTKDKLSEYNK